VRYLGVNVVKYLRRHLEQAMAAPEEPGMPPWDGTDGKVAVEPWPADEPQDAVPPERVWEVRILARRLPKVIGAR